MKERLKYVDIARGIAIVLVVMGHCDNFKSWSIEKFAALFFMQVFVFISGIFYKKNINSLKDLIIVVKEKCMPIYKYYLKFELLFFLLTNIFIKIGFYNLSIEYGGKYISEISSFNEIIIRIIKIVLLMGREPFCGAFWFLVTLIFIIITYSFITYISKKVFGKKSSIGINIMIILCFIIGCIMKYTYSIPRLSPTFTLILFFHIGKLYGNNIEKIKFDKLTLFFVSLVILNIMYFYGSINMNSNSFTDPIYLLICSLAGIYVVMFISKIIENKTKTTSLVLSYIGQNTLPIVALHFISFKTVMLFQMIFGFITFDQLGLLKGANNNNIIYVFYVVSGVTIPIIVTYLIKRIKKGWIINLIKEKNILCFWK